MSKANSEQQSVVRSAMWAIALLAPVLAACAYFLFGAKGILGSVGGGAIAFANLWAVARVVRGMVEETRLRSRWSLLAIFKVLALITAVFAMVQAGLPILAIAVGYAALPIGIVIGQLWAPAPADDPAPHKG